METQNEVGKRLRRYRAQSGLTQPELAEKSSVGVTTIVRIEKNQVEPQGRTVRKLAKALGVDPHVLFGGITHSPAPRPEPIATVGGTFTAIYELTEDGWWVVSVPEIPGAHSQGETLEEARMMIKDAVGMLLEVRREDAERETEGKKNVVREPLEL